ncbi:hypothetical protein GBAR_LOCUS13187 [Geodia barretti]|uniref:Uncharacterized protein n=1 Tax=Geodia barretti TaxID=519541 RepID=A0AA35WQC9_GEOBA|nr:hypothetical protein GBAR_LOCUS13187 [Geodia barretti]
MRTFLADKSRWMMGGHRSCRDMTKHWRKGSLHNST